MSIRRMKRHEIDTREELLEFIASGKSLKRWVIQGVDLTGIEFGETEVNHTLFIGCTFANPVQRNELMAHGAQFLVRFDETPYQTYRNALYTIDELFDGYEEGGYVNTLDFRIYEHSDRERHHEGGVSIREALAQRLHDHAVEDAMHELLESLEARGVVGIMGGHSTPRTSPDYRAVVHTTWDLTRRGYFIASGGGPGIMEAANLGAFLAPFADPRVIAEALEVLAHAPSFDGGHEEGSPQYLGAIKQYIAVARRVRDLFFGPNSEAMAKRFQRESDTPGESLAVPTWFYGHEPTNLFGNHVAKFFSNSLREDGLLAIADAGVVYAPGSAGTLQEVFMDLAQNHYATFKMRSPMVFLGVSAFTATYTLIRDFLKSRGVEELYGDMITLVDEPVAACNFIEAHPPRPRIEVSPLYDLIT